jgi:ribonucleotide reductase alpha subunit
MWNENWEKGEDFPSWGNTDVYKKTISGGYLLQGETPRDAYMRVSLAVARRLYKPEMAETFFNYIWNGWLCLASPVLSNTGTDRGLPISCFGIDVADSIQDIGQKNLEMMLLAKHGGGVGIGINQIRPAGAKITGNGTSDGVVPFCKIYDSTILATNQGSVRRGAASVNINIRSAQKGRALGLGVLGWHTYLQEKGIPFEGLLSQFETRKIFSQIKIESERASMALAETYGEPLWCAGTGYRNTHLRAVAPTVSNSKLSGNVSAGVEPWAANVFTDQSAKGTFIRKNPTLLKLLRKHKINTNEIWDKILADGGSVQDISELDEITVGTHEIPAKEVFKTFKEINQLELVNQAGLRQQYIDQSVSLNLAFPSEATPKWLNKVHFDAWKKGVKTLYYTRTESVLRGDIAQQAMSEDCLACDG